MFELKEKLFKKTTNVLVHFLRGCIFSHDPQGKFGLVGGEVRCERQV